MEGVKGVILRLCVDDTLIFGTGIDVINDVNFFGLKTLIWNIWERVMFFLHKDEKGWECDYVKLVSLCGEILSRFGLNYLQYHMTQA